MLNCEERFWSKVKKQGPDECWVWQGTISKNGYGSFKLAGKAQTSSRVAWLASYGRPAGENMVLHKCDNRPCCNPAHLYLGDVKQNARDMVERGRRRSGPVKGEHNGNSKLTETQVAEIKRLIASGKTNKAIAPLYGVTHQMISKIRRGHFWKHVATEKGEAA
jgi:hypothetical protein